jgi:cysteine sulfinate desulfinase/cysteine desulfurase-like protein
MVIRDILSKNNIVVGVGSACNSEVKETMGSMRSADIPEEIKNGFIRISLSCYNTVDEVKKLVKVLSVFSR